MLKKNILIGFDGFIDTIVRAVDHYDGDRKVYMRLIDQFGKRISSAAGRSTNIELDVICKKIGGNGPILCDALRALGANTTYIGTLGNVREDIFKNFANSNRTFSIGVPGETRAVEFDDGKILLGEMYDIVNVDADSVCSACNKEVLRKIASESELLCFVNWTMLLKMNSILELFLNDIIPAQGKHIFFFDLADPAKRKAEDIRELVKYIKRFSEIGTTILGMNLSEAEHVFSVLKHPVKFAEQRDSMVQSAQVLRDEIGCGAIFIHANTMSAGYDGNTAFVTGYFSEYPKISTGAGDHFNAGFLFEYLNNRDIESALHMGSAVAKYYVENACSPDIAQAQNIIKEVS